MIDIVGFLKSNKNKKVTLQVWIYAAWFRFLIRFIPMKYLRKHFGIQGEESTLDSPAEGYKYAKLISMHVDKSAGNTPWESKCLVRALTAQRLLKKKNISIEAVCDRDTNLWGGCVNHLPIISPFELLDRYQKGELDKVILPGATLKELDRRKMFFLVVLY